MKKIIAVICISFLLMNCSSNDDVESVATDINSSITIDGVAFVPTEVITSSGTSIDGEGTHLFMLRKQATNESIVVRVHYPLNSSVAPNGVYDFGMGETGTMLFADGGYTSNSSMYSLAGYTVQVTKLPGNNKYKLDFQNVQAAELNSNNIIIISGSCEGTFN